MDHDDAKLYRAYIRAMPGNPASRRVGDDSGLHMVIVAKRRGSCVEDEDIQYIAGQDLVWDEAHTLSSRLNAEFAGRQVA
jgi:hypothetical protein